MAELVLPSRRHFKSFLAALQEPQTPGPTQLPEFCDMRDHFDERLGEWEEERLGKNLKPDRVPQTTYWLVEGDEFIGRVAIRHRLNERLEQMGGHIGYIIRPSKRGQGYGTMILRLALEKAREMGLSRVCITCDPANAASRKMIERCGGVRQDVITFEGAPVARYWIGLV